MRAFALLALAMAATVAETSAQGTTVRGSVVSPEGAQLAFAVVSLEPGHGERFTDGAGNFYFGGVQPGQYHLRARRLGYRPVDTLLTVTAAPASVQLAMPRIEVTLSAIRVTASRRCRSPGAPDAARNRELATIFQQLRENAVRYRLAAARHPFSYAVERRYTAIRHDGLRIVERVDTVLTRGDLGMRYAPGQLIVEVMVNGRPERQLKLPTLPDLADSAFVSAHCFGYGGLEDIAGVPHLRVDFFPHDDIRESDISGFALLDRESYQIRRLSFTLTRPGQAMPGLAKMSVTTVFRELTPPLVAFDTIRAVTVFDPRTSGGALRERTELQRLIDFQPPRAPGALPGGAPPPAHHGAARDIRAPRPGHPAFGALLASPLSPRRPSGLEASGRQSYVTARAPR